MWIESWFCTAKSKKVPPAQEQRGWDISNKSSANAKKDLTKFPYKISTCLKLTDTEKQKRTEMCNRVAEQMDRFQNWTDKVWFTDEAHLHLNGAVNHHNNVYRKDEIPKDDCSLCIKCKERDTWAILV